MKQARHKRTNIVLFLLHKVPRIGKFIETERRIEFTRGWGRGNGELLFFQFGMMKVLEKDSGDGCSTMCIYLMPLN